MERRRLSLFCVVIGLLVATSLRAAPTYTITFLDTLPVPSGADPSIRDSFAYAINEQGIVVGESTLDRTGNIGQTRPALWNGSSEAVELWDDETFGGKGLGINSAGFVVGRYGSGSGVPLPGPGIPDGGAFIWNPATRQFMDLGDFGGARAEATGINEGGQVSGSAEALETFIIDGMPVLLPVPRAFIWDEVNGMRDLGTLEGNGEGSRGTAINNDGKVVGWSLMSDGTERAFIWDEANGMQALASESSRALAINDHGEVVGRLLGDGVTIPPRSFIWDELSLQLLPSEMGQPSGINNNREVIDLLGNIWDEMNGMRRVVDLLPPLGNWEISSLSAINDKGQIAGTAFNTVDGRFRGILLTRIPEPNAFVLSCVGSLLLMWRRHRTHQVPYARIVTAA